MGASCYDCVVFTDREKLIEIEINDMRGVVNKPGHLYDNGDTYKG